MAIKMVVIVLCCRNVCITVLACCCGLKGISPRLEFSTKTIIQQTVTPLLEPWDLDVSYFCTVNFNNQLIVETLIRLPVQFLMA